ncbi:hypothetical protein [Gordonia caeni]|uniref:hypothetical protein n=1 Tax=Gordonia caeni TaxID=1007097 RepID=UPI0031DA0F32
MTPGAIAIAGPLGAAPDELAAALSGPDAQPVLVLGPGVPAPARLHAGVLAVDLSCAAGTADEELLAGLVATGAPVALVGVGAGQDGGWPARLAAARTRLDPGHRLPVFAVSLELLRAGDPDGGGLDAVARWCADPEPVDGAAERSAPASDAAGAPRDEVRPGGFQRAERLAGARAGFTAVRARLAASARSGAHDLGDRAQAACDHLGRPESAAFTGWLQASLEVYRDRIGADLEEGIDQVRAAALSGLPGPTAGPAEESAPVTESVRAPAVPGRSPSAEELVLLALGGSAGLGLGRVTVAPLVHWAGLGAAGTVLTVLAGLAVAAAVVGVRRQTAARAALRRAAAESIAATRSALEHAAASRLGAAEAHLSRELWNRTGTSCVQPSRE